LLVLILLAVNGLAAMPVYAAPPRFRDVRWHWAESNINHWLSLGLVGGYSDGTFRPDKTVTRAEYVSFLNRAFGFSAEVTINFVDVKPTDWFYHECARAVCAGYADELTGGNFAPDAPVSRLEAGVMLYRAMRLEHDTSPDASAGIFDWFSIPEKHRTAVNALVSRQLMVGSSGIFDPYRIITRAEAIAILDRGAGTIYNSGGTYGPEIGTARASGNVTITQGGTLIRNLTIDGDLYVSEGVSGTVTLVNVTVDGRTLVAGPVNDSLNLEGSTFLNQGAIVDSRSGAPEVKDNIIGSVRRTVVFYSSGSYTAKDTGGVRPMVVIAPAIMPGSRVSLAGKFSTLAVEAEHEASLTMADSSIALLSVADSAENVDLSIQESRVDRFMLGGQARLTVSAASVGELSLGGSSGGSVLNLENAEVGQLSLGGAASVTVDGGSVGALTIPEGTTGGVFKLAGGTIGQVSLAGSADLSFETGTIGSLVMAGTGTGSKVTIGANAYMDQLTVPKGTDTVTQAEGSVGQVVYTEPDGTPPGPGTPPENDNGDGDEEPPVGIVDHIDTVVLSTEVGVMYALPTSVTAVMRDGTSQEVPVTWVSGAGVTITKGKVTINGVGGWPFAGTVRGYRGSVDLILVVNNTSASANIEFDIVE
jgi:hypothetical protein